MERFPQNVSVERFLKQVKDKLTNYITSQMLIPTIIMTLRLKQGDIT